LPPPGAGLARQTTTKEPPRSLSRRIRVKQIEADFPDNPPVHRLERRLHTSVALSRPFFDHLDKISRVGLAVCEWGPALLREKTVCYQLDETFLIFLRLGC
jgi:hypothetical protein